MKKGRPPQGKGMKKETQPTPEKSLGTDIAAKHRSQANTFSDEKRRQLLDRGLAIIYGGSDNAPKANHNCR